MRQRRWYEYPGCRGPVPFWRVWFESSLDWLHEDGARQFYCTILVALVLWFILQLVQR